MEAQIKAEFKKSGFSIDEEEEVLNKCLTFCTNYKLTPSELVLSWEVYFLNRQLNGSTIQNAEMEGFLLHLQNEEKEAFITEEPNLHVYSSRDVDMILHDEQEDIKEGILDTPTLHQDSSNSVHQANGGKFSSGITSSFLTPFGQRTNKFVVQFSINNQHIRDSAREQQDIEQSESDFISKVLPGKRCSLLVCQSKPEPGCRFMYDRIEDRCNSLENRLKKHASAFVASGLYEPVDPTIASQKSVFAVGMICCDGQGHLNEKSILLQSSVEHSGGQHVRLDLGKLTHYSIFPGQVVGIVGNNPSGHCFIASEILYPSSFSISADENLHPAKRQALEEESSMIDQLGVLEELSMIIAGGPYTTTDNLLFEPLTELLAYASRKQPQLLILSGPFVDSEHPEIKKGTLDKSFDEVFRQEVLRRLQDHVEYMGSASQVLLVPSIRDANHDFVFPQSSFDINSVDLKHQITSLTNPGIFDAEEVKIGCCTVDILRQLSGEEISRHPKDGSSADRISRLVKHILSQHSFYPLYPPAEDVPLDFSIAPETLNFSCSPQILILPSDLSPFIKVLSLEGQGEGKQPTNCICVNPGRLAKGIGGGTFVELNYHGSPDTTHGSIIRI